MSDSNPHHVPDAPIGEYPDDPTPGPGGYSPRAVNWALPRTQVRRVGAEAAYRVLVNGERVASVARSMEVHDQTVSRAKARVEKAIRETREANLGTGEGSDYEPPILVG